MSPTIAELLGQHTSLSITCIDRLYVNGYLRKLQTGGQLYWYLGEYLGKPVPSPALLRPIHDRFVRGIKDYASTHGIDLVRFRRGQRKDDIAATRRAKFHKPEGVVFVGVAQERCKSFRATKRGGGSDGPVNFWFDRQPAFVNQYYFYVEDPDWGPAFLKVGSYLPYPVKLCLNGHEWAKRRLDREGIGYESLDNGFLACEDPQRLQAICDELAPRDVRLFFRRWSTRLPWPLSPQERADGFDHRLSIWQFELSHTQVFDRPVQGRHFFEQVIRENIDLGRPDRVSLLFATRHNRKTPPPKRGYRTRVITTGVNPSLHVEYKKSHVKQYFKENRALRTETTINDPLDVRVNKGIDHLPELREIGRTANERLLEIERTSESCVLSQDEMDRLQQSTDEDGQRASPLRFGDPRVMALLHALCLFAHVVMGFRNRQLRAHIAALLGLDLDTYTAGRMTYDLRRLRLKGLIVRIPSTHRYRLTPKGLRVAYFYSKLHLRILRPGWACIGPPTDAIPRDLRRAFAALDDQIDRLCTKARLQAAA